MTWEQFLEDNQYNLDYEELEALDEDDLLINMEEIIDLFKETLEVNNESPKDIVYIEQDGDYYRFVKIWTKYRVYFSHIDDSHDIHVYSAFRHPPYVVVK